MSDCRRGRRGTYVVAAQSAHYFARAVQLNFDALVGAYGGNTHAVRLTSIPSDGGHGESKQRSERQKNGGQLKQQQSSVAALVVVVETKE